MQKKNGADTNSTQKNTLAFTPLHKQCAYFDIRFLIQPALFLNIEIVAFLCQLLHKHPFMKCGGKMSVCNMLNNKYDFKETKASQVS